MSTLNNVLLLCTSVFCIACIIKNFNISRIVNKDEDNVIQENGLVIPGKIYMVLLGAGALIAILIRVWKFGEVPGGFNQDGVMASVDAKALAEYGTDRYGMRLPVHLTAWGYGQMSALLSYLMVPFIRLFGFSPLVLRLPQLLASIAGLVCLYFLIKDVFGKDMALIVFLFAAINPWHILQSRWTLDCNLYPHFFVFGIYFFNKGLKKKYFLSVSMFFFGLCMYCYGISIYTMPLFLLMACVYLIATKRIHILDALLPAVVYLVTGGPFILVMMINFFKWDTIETPLFTLPYFPDSVRSNDILFFSENVGSQLIENFKSLMNVTLLQVKDLPWNDIEGFGTMYLFSMPFVILGIIFLFVKFRKNPGAMFIFFFLLTGVLCGLLTNGVNVNRINIIYYPIIIMAGIGIYEGITLFKISKPCVAAVYLVAFALLANIYFTTYATEIRWYFHGDFGDALDAVQEDGIDKYYITNYYNSADLTQILILFHHCIDSRYFQGVTEEGGLPFTQKYTIINTEEMPDGTDENAAYVVNSSEIAYFDTELYEVQQFGDYYTLKRKK